MGAAFGSGNSGSLFGASGGANFLSRTTSVLAAVFFVCTLFLAYFGNLRPASTGSVLERTSLPATAPATAGDQIPGGTTAPATAVKPDTTPAPVAPAPTTPASQIPTK
jgi:preprotein translocase subunit SecG